MPIEHRHVSARAHTLSVSVCLTVSLSVSMAFSLSVELASCFSLSRLQLALRFLIFPWRSRQWEIGGFLDGKVGSSHRRIIIKSIGKGLNLRLIYWHDLTAVSVAMLGNGCTCTVADGS